MAETRAGCCNNSSVTKLIGILKVVVCLISIVFYTSSLKQHYDEVSHQISLKKVGLDYNLVFYAVLIVVTTISSIYGLILLIGAIRKSIPLMTAWLVWTPMGIFLYMALVAIRLAFGDPKYVITPVLAIGFDLFGLFIVSTHIQDVNYVKFHDEIILHEAYE